MPLSEQTKAVHHLFSGITGEGRYKRKELPTGRVQLLFDNAQIGGWADDSNGPHWYVLENKRIVSLNPSYQPILELFGFKRITHDGRRYYWRVRGAEGMWAFKRAVEEITGSSLACGVAHSQRRSFLERQRRLRPADPPPVSRRAG